MDKIASDLNDYLLVVNKYFSNEKIDESKVNDPRDFRYLFSTNLQNTWEKKMTEIERWNSLFQLFGEFDWALHTRDMSFDLNHGFKLVLTFKHPELPMRNIGIICHLSLIGNLIGLYYADSKTTKNNQPIGNPHKSSLTINNGQYEPYTSYSPFNDLHIKYKEVIIKTVHQIFPEFTEFDNCFADHKITSIQLDDDYYASIDLFQVFFGNNIHGVI